MIKIFVLYPFATSDWPVEFPKIIIVVSVKYSESLKRHFSV